MRTWWMALAVVLATSHAWADSPPVVVASIKPIHSLVGAVMEGVGTPVLLVRGGASPHAYALRPSDARALQRARLVFWVGPGLEGFLSKPVAALAGDTRAVALSAVDGMKLLRPREGGEWDDDGDHDHDAHGDGADMHVWLDPANARRMVEAVAEELAAVDPGHAATYRANADRQKVQLTALDDELRDLLAPVAARPFIVFHDGYHYLEDRYGLTAVGSVTVSPERAPSPRRLSALRKKVLALGAVCVFQEPQFPPKLVRTLVEGTAARVGALDPNGADLPDGSDLYFKMMRNNGRSLRACLAP